MPENHQMTREKGFAYPRHTVFVNSPIADGGVSSTLSQQDLAAFWVT